MEPVENREIELLRKGLEQVGRGVPDEGLHGLIQVSDVDERRVGMDLRETSAEPPVRHVVLHDLDGVRIRNLQPTHFVKCNHVPMTDKPNLPPCVVVEQVRGTGLSA